MEEDEDDLYAENGDSETTHERKVQTAQGGLNDLVLQDAGEDDDEEEEESDSDSVMTPRMWALRWQV
jgi:hypothetical protein